MLKKGVLTFFSTRYCLAGLLMVGLLSATMSTSFRTEQKKFPRVRKAYSNTEKTLKSLFDSLGQNYANFKLIITANKQKEKLYVYASSTENGTFEHIKTYNFCVLSGNLGPKRKEGDYQVPEGFYHISKFNPSSNFHLSMKINYPNASDKILSDKKTPGGEIYIHGHCVSVGCIPITDAGIEELYVLCVEATAHGQQQIPVYIFPFAMDDETMKKAAADASDNSTHLSFWKNMQPGYKKWKSTRNKLKFTVNTKGKYTFQ